MLEIGLVNSVNDSSDIEDYIETTNESLDSSEEDLFKAKPCYEFAKRIFDVFACLVAIVVLFPFLCIVALIIFIDDPKGSPIFSQVRCGKNGKKFKIYKFRTMCNEAEDLLSDLRESNEMDGPVFKIKHDPRITKVGKFLRSTGIDELPQLLNILKGDMSVVGPRPALPDEVAQYSDKNKLRLSVLPGLTCIWQIQPNRNSLSFEEWMKLDEQYVKERCMLVDIIIIFKTVSTVLKMQGC